MFGEKANSSMCTGFEFVTFNSIPSGLGQSPRAPAVGDASRKAPSHSAPWAEGHTTPKSPHFMHQAFGGHKI